MSGDKDKGNFKYADSSDEPVEESTVSGEVAQEEDVDNTKQAGVAAVKKGGDYPSTASFPQG